MGYFKICHKVSSNLKWNSNSNLQRNRLKMVQKYKGKCVHLGFCILHYKNYENLWFYFHKSICLLDMVLLIPILLWFMTFYILWYVSQNYQKCHFMTHAICYNMSSTTAIWVLKEPYQADKLRAIFNFVVLHFRSKIASFNEKNRLTFEKWKKS